MLVLLPLEPLEIRYTKQWDYWFADELDRIGIHYIVVKGKPLTTGIELGSVLDAYGTNYWKAAQMASLIEHMQKGIVTSNDTLLFADLWSPGIEALHYIACMGGARPKVTGILHAGTWDANDFTYRQGMRPWGHLLEQCWFQFFDLVFLGTGYHKDLILGSHNVDPDRLVVTGLPFYPDEFTVGRAKQPKVANLVVFPHRLDTEKHPEEFNAIMARHPEWEGTKTAENFTGKDRYYDTLGRASVAISCATQETFGYAMLEATALGCVPLVPDRLSYKELFPPELRYQTLYELEDKLCYVMENLPLYRERLRYTQKNHRRIGAEAIPRICHQIEKLRDS